MPKRPPPEALTALADYARKEQAARERNSPAAEETVRGFLGRYRAAYAGTREPLSVRELDKAIRTFVGWCDRAGIRSVREVTPAACHRWISERAAERAQGRGGGTIQHATLTKERALLAAAWSQAARRKEIPDNPWTAAPVPGKPARKVRGSWSPEEYGRLLAACRPWLRDLLILGCNTGLRIEAMRGLEWRDIAWAKPGAKGFGWVIVRPELDKAKNGYRVPMNRAVHDMLARRFLHRDAHVRFVLTGGNDQPIASINTSDRAIRKACKRAGLPEPSAPNHHCRRTFGRWAVAGHLTGRPVPLYILSRWYGHASINMTMKYLDVREDDSTRFMLGGAGEEDASSP